MSRARYFRETKWHFQNKESFCFNNRNTTDDDNNDNIDNDNDALTFLAPI